MCDCIDKVNAKLSPHNTRLVTTFSVNVKTRKLDHLPALKVEKIVTKNRTGPALAIPSFCPFCGEKYESTIRAGRPAHEVSA